MLLSIRVSARARRLSIRVYPDARVEVVVPPRARPREVELFIAAHREWIDSKRAMALRNRPEPQPFPPATLDLRALVAKAGACTWRAARAGCGSSKDRIGGKRVLRVTGAAATDKLRAALRAWLMRAAHEPAGAARGRAGRGDRGELFAGFRPAPAFALG